MSATIAGDLERAQLLETLTELDDAGRRASAGAECSSCRAKRTLAVDVATRNVIHAARQLRAAGGLEPAGTHPPTPRGARGEDGGHQH